MSLLASFAVAVLLLAELQAPPGEAPPQATARDAAAPLAPAPDTAPAAAPDPGPPVTAVPGPPVEAVPPPIAGPPPVAVAPPPPQPDDSAEPDEAAEAGQPRPPAQGYTTSDEYLEARMREAYIVAERRQGPINGSWLVKSTDGAPLFRIEMVDAGLAYPLEGAWSDVRAKGILDAHGFLNGAARSTYGLTLSFTRADGTQESLTLDPRPAGGYAGELVRGEARTPVVMTRP